VLRSLNSPQPTCQRPAEDLPGILQHGPTGRLPTQQLPEPAWLAPDDLQKPFTCAHARSCMASIMQTCWMPVSGMYACKSLDSQLELEEEVTCWHAGRTAWYRTA
jgi:hypothetical protein